MSITKRESILRRSPYRDRRPFRTFLSPLSPIGDIGAANFAETTTDSITWETSTDWDSAVAETGVVHDTFGDYPGGDSVQMGVSKRPDMVLYMPLHDSSGPTADVINGNDGTVNGPTLDATPGVVNATSAEFNEANNDRINIPSSTDYRINAPITVSFMVYFDNLNESLLFQGTEDSASTCGPRIWNGGGGSSFIFRFYTDSGNTSVSTSASGYSTGTWYVFTATMYSGGNVEAWIDKNSVGTASGSDTNLAWVGNSRDTILGSRGSSNGDPFPGHMANVFMTNTEWSQSLQDDLVDSVNNSGALTSGTKSFSSPTQPNLSSLSYSLNSENINLDVIGSPGTASEEIVTQALDGSTSYSLTWSNSHTDFRIRPNFTTADVTKSATFSAATLNQP